MRVLILVGLAVASLLAYTAPARADSMRCRGRLVTDGDSRSAVRARCGSPTEVQTRSILRRPHYSLNGRLVYYGEGLVEIPVEVWTYNFGPYKLMRRVTFVDGLVEEIETLEHGFHETEPEDSGNRG
jgi:hypothetical protein